MGNERGPNPDVYEINPWDDEPEDFEECPNCGGEGVIYSCFEEYACVDPEGGCDLCERRCDWCMPVSKALGKDAP